MLLCFVKSLASVGITGIGFSVNIYLVATARKFSCKVVDPVLATKELFLHMVAGKLFMLQEIYLDLCKEISHLITRNNHGYTIYISMQQVSLCHHKHQSFQVPKQPQISSQLCLKPSFLSYVNQPSNDGQFMVNLKICSF